MKTTEKYDLSDITFLIPVRLDSVIRLENFILTIEALCKSFNTKIMVLEASSYNSGIIQSLSSMNFIEYHFVKDNDPIFHRTKYLNIMTRRTSTPFIAIWDADVVIRDIQIIDSIRNLRNHYFDIAFPYDGHFYDTTEILRKHYIINKDINFLIRNEAKMKLLYGNQMIGGAIIVNTQQYIEAGMENENFYGWGQEDNERFYRWKNLNLNIYRSSGSLYHLSHPRDINGIFK